jgi:hypothetical protein
MTMADLAAGNQAHGPYLGVAGSGISEDHGAMNMQQPSRRVIAEPVSLPVTENTTQQPALKPPIAREVPATARSEPVGSS